MSILETIKNRRSIRNFLPDPVPPGVLNQLKDALLWAPSAGNLQARQFFLITDKNKKDELAEAALGQDFIAEAPLVIVACADLKAIMPYGKRGRELYVFCDVACSVQNLMLVAKENNLGSVWVGAFNDDLISQALSLPKHLKPVAIIPLGFPQKIPAPPKRKKAEEMIHEV